MILNNFCILRRGLCCDDDGVLLLAFSKDLKMISQHLMPESKKEVLYVKHLTLFLKAALFEFIEICGNFSIFMT